ncbi:hypothetical protein D3C81_1353270 [compost metagenome]
MSLILGCGIHCRHDYQHYVRDIPCEHSVHPYHKPALHPAAQNDTELDKPYHFHHTVLLSELFRPHGQISSPPSHRHL